MFATFSKNNNKLKQKQLSISISPTKEALKSEDPTPNIQTTQNAILSPRYDVDLRRSFHDPNKDAMGPEMLAAARYYAKQKAQGKQ